MKPLRFVYIGNPARTVVHIHYGKLLEGEAVACGQRLQRGWKWGPRKHRTVCKRCEAAR